MRKIQIILIFIMISLIIFNIACFNKKNQTSEINTERNVSLTDDKENTQVSALEDSVNTGKEIENFHQDNNSNNNSEKEKSGENIVFEKPVQNPLRTFPRLSIQIIEGPVVPEDSSLCYYRIYVKAIAYPRASLSFSKDDSLGAWGINTVQINLLPEEAYDLKILASNEIGKASAVVSLSWQEVKIIYGDTIVASDENNPVFYHIDVSVDEQKVRVYYKDKLLKEMVCSTGAPETPTPTGAFKTNDKIFYSWLPKYDVGAYYFVRFFNSYLFHSIPFDNEDNIIKEELDNLGKASSHGCIRLGLEDARWFYENLPAGITVEIR